MGTSYYYWWAGRLTHLPFLGIDLSRLFTGLLQLLLCLPVASHPLLQLQLPEEIIQVLVTAPKDGLRAVKHHTFSSSIHRYTQIDR